MQPTADVVYFSYELLTAKSKSLASMVNLFPDNP
jgi:hypothetical protein